MGLILPEGSKFKSNPAVSRKSVDEILVLIKKVGNSSERQWVYEQTKLQLYRATGDSYSTSSSIGWAESDMVQIANKASENGVTFLEAIYEAFDVFEEKQLETPGSDLINQILERNDDTYRISDGHLKLASSKVSLPQVSNTPNQTIIEALDDAKILLQEEKYPSAVDRLHTSFHGYLKELCVVRGIKIDRNSSTVSKLYKELKNSGAFEDKHGKQDNKVDQVLKGMSSIIDALSPIRNHQSLAHANDLLEKTEAKLIVNSINSIYQYIHEKVQESGF